MNGNPFRKQAPPPIQTNHPTAGAEPEPEPAVDRQDLLDARDPPSNAASSAAIRKGKTVRISSPPRSPISPPHPSHAAAVSVNNKESDVHSSIGTYRPARSHHDTPSTPYARTFPRDQDDEDEDEEGEGEKEDPFGKEESSSEDETSPDAEHLSGPPTATNPVHGVPPNPFSRTLATMEEPLRSAMRQNRTPEQAEPVQAEKRLPRASLDVDAFKNLLMTGKATPALPSKNSQHKPHSLTLADNSSSTDTSSISRQSLFEPGQGIPLESPRTSYERSISEDEDDRTDVMKERRKSQKVKPPPPKHRHGKAVGPKGPQVVSFSDFSPSFDDPTAQSFPLPLSSPSVPFVSTLHRRDSDMDKPLPPRPSSRDSTSIDKDLKAPKRPSFDAPLQDGSDPTSPRRVPPAPPLARRSSVLRATDPTTRARSNTQNSNLSQTDDNTALRSYPESIAESTTSSHKVAPPPPPARRSGAVHLASNQQASSSEEGLTLSRTSSLRSAPPPPSRNRSMSALSSPASAASGIMSPPPRPPPRRTSSRSSMEGTPHAQASPTGSRRTSAEHRRSTDVERRPSMASIIREGPITEESMRDDHNASPDKYGVEHVTSPAAPSQSESDVLAEMEAFQREIDELAKQAARADAAQAARSP